MAKGTLPLARDTHGLSRLLASPEIAHLIADLESTRWTGRPGYPIRAMVGMALVKSLYSLPTWTRTVRLVGDHAGLRSALGCAPSVDACYRFGRKLRDHSDRLDACIASVLESLRAKNPSMGDTVAIDGSDLPAYANGQRYLSARSKIERKRYSDPDASWGHRSSISTRKGGGFYGYKVHSVVDIATELPVAWQVRTARDAETPLVPGLLDQTRAHGFDPTVAILDRGYDQTSVYEACEVRDIRPVIPLRMTPAVKAGKHLPPQETEPMNEQTTAAVECDLHPASEFHADGFWLVDVCCETCKSVSLAGEQVSPKPMGHRLYMCPDHKRPANQVAIWKALAISRPTN